MSEQTRGPSAEANSGRRNYRVLVLAPFGRDAPEICRVLRAAGLDVECCAGADELCRGIAQGAAAAVAAEEVLSPDTRRCLAAALAEQPEWSDFPLVILVSRNKSRRDAWNALRGIEGTSHLSLLERPLHTATLLASVTAAVQSRRRQYQVRDELVARRRAEADLRESEARFRSVLENALDAAYRRNLQTDRYDYLSPAIERITGYSVEEMTRFTLAKMHERIHPEDREPFRRSMSAGIEAGEGTVEYRFRDHEGNYRWLGDYFAVQKDAAGYPLYRSGIVRDITEQKRSEEALSRLNESLEQQVDERTAVAEQRARTLRRLAAELSEAEHRERQRLAKILHDDLQQLLVAARLRLASIRRSGEERVVKTAESVDGLIDECISASRGLTTELSPPILYQGTLPEVLAWLGRWFGEKHGLSVAVDACPDLPDPPEHVRVFFFQAVRELLFNVVKHSGVKQARVRLSQRDGRLEVGVEDHGRGFEPEAAEDRLDEEQGFGLFNIRERLEALDGKLEIDSSPGAGTRIRLGLPAPVAFPVAAEAGEADVPESARQAAAAPAAAAGVTRLLLVDDHKVVREGLAGLLARQEDFEVVGEAADGEEAIRLARSLRPDVIVMDINMPGMGGIEATRQIRHHQPDSRIVALSLHEEDEVIRAVTQAGAAAYVCKDGPANELFAAIRAARDRKPRHVGSQPRPRSVHS